MSGMTDGPSRVRPHERVARALRERIRTGQWEKGQMIPGRRRLAEAHGVALTTLERAVTTLISEGLLRADDRRGTFVTNGSAATPSGRQWPRPDASSGREALVATVGIVAAVVPYGAAAVYESQWPVQTLHGCEHRLATESGLTLRFINTVVAGRTDLPVAAAAGRLLAEAVDAAIFIQLVPSAALLRRLAAARVPVVLAGYDPLPTTVPHVCIDSLAGGALAARHLLERGYSKLVFFQPFTTEWTEQRLAGVKSCLANLGRPPHVLRVVPSDPAVSVGQATDQQALSRERAMQELAAGWEDGIGVIAPNDSVAVGFMEAAEAHGMVAGRDYGIVGFDDSARDRGLTSLRPPLAALGEEAARLVTHLLRGEDAPSRVALQHRLIARTSSLPAGCGRANAEHGTQNAERRT